LIAGPVLDRLSKRVRRGLEAVANVGELPGRQVDPLLLHFRALLLAVSTLLLTVGASLQRFELGRHLLHGVSEFGQLSGDARYVLGSCDSAAILRPESRRAKPTENSKTGSGRTTRVVGEVADGVCSLGSVCARAC
jgi:hypothetical protein